MTLREAVKKAKSLERAPEDWVFVVDDYENGFQPATQEDLDTFYHFMPASRIVWSNADGYYP